MDPCTLRLSPFTPSLTASPTISSSTTASPLIFPEFLPHEPWIPVEAAPWLLSSPSGISPGISPDALFLNPEADPPKSKKRRLEREPMQRVRPSSPPPPAIVAIPPAQASDIPFELARKPSRKRAAPHGSRRAKAARKEPSPLPQPPQPIRFRFVAVQHAESAQPELSAEFEEHIIEDDMDTGPFEHGPTELPPRPYPGGEYAVSPLQPAPKIRKIPASSLDFLPVLEARFSKLEYAIERYVALRAQTALRNSILPEARPGASPPSIAARWPVLR